MIVLLVFWWGACLGSFLNVCVERWAHGRSIIRPPSRCDGCRRQLRPWENLPILGWLTLRGRCGGCGARISAQYLLFELAIALLWLLVLALGISLQNALLALWLTGAIGALVQWAKYGRVVRWFGWGILILLAAWVISLSLARL